MESGGKGEDGVFDVFRDGGFVELLGAVDLGGVGELMDMEDERMEQKVIRVAEGEEVGLADEFFLRCPSAYPLLSSSSPASSFSRMLCFGGDEGFPWEGNNRAPQKSSASGNDTSTSSSSSNSGLSMMKKKTVEARGCSAAADRGRTSTTFAKGTATTTKTATNATKKPRREQPLQRPASQGRTLKVRKENLGERITALQHLVSPFGKSDTASVLHEALGYIRFLHSQVQVLSSPYMQRLPSSAHADGGGEGEARHDLRSRGLCLVPVACTAQTTGSNGADFWSPAMGSCIVDCHEAHHPVVTEH